MPRGLRTPTTGPLHHALHFFAFAGIALGPSSWASRLSGKLAVTASVIGLGAILELLQHYFFGNAYEWADFRDDSVGAVMGSLLLPALTVLARMAARY
ncbi:MAG: hypothetical protein ACR2JB_13150 [Bryobacteraceae bacterium]